MQDLPELIDGVPNICGQEDLIADTISKSRGKDLLEDNGKILPNAVRSACACALHMHQPLIPAGGHDLSTAEVISNLQHMMENQGIGDNHNAPVFEWCYKRMGEFIPELVREGKSPRIMLEYSGSLFYGLRKMGLDHVLDQLGVITNEKEFEGCAEWLGAPWGHAVAPSTPVQDFRLHVQAWQHHFAALYGTEALERVRGFSPSEMALPNHPDIAYEFVKTLRDCGYQYVVLQEHTVEQPKDGHHPHRKYIPNRLVCKNSKGEEAEIIAIIKTQGSDTKLVAQMQPYYEAKGLGHENINGIEVPSLVFQIADGENGGVMMNEFPPKFKEVARESAGNEVTMLNVSEYLDHLAALGVKAADFPEVQPVHQKQIWDRVEPGCGSEKLEATIEDIKKENHQFHMEGGSWTDDISWVNGYENVLGPMEKASSLFHEKVLTPGIPSDDSRYRNALFYLLSSQTSCYRYWGQGTWVDYGRELCRRTESIINNDFRS